MIQELKLNNTEAHIKYDILKSIGVTVETRKYNEIKKLVISVKDRPDIDKYMETTFCNVDEILKAFRYELSKQKIKLAA